MRLLVVFLLFCLVGCSDDCTYLKRLTTQTQCRAASIDKKKTQLPTSATCATNAAGRKLHIVCSDAGSSCSSATHGSSYFAAIVPNNNSGQFIDSVIGPLADCNDLWSAISQRLPLRDVVGVFYGDSSIGAFVDCSTTPGQCIANNTTQCFAGWDPDNSIPTTTAASFSTTGKYLACVFIDANDLGGGIGPPPVSGMPSAINGTSFIVSGTAQMTIGATTIDFLSWGTY